MSVEWNDAKGVAQRGDFDRLIVSIGRVPNTVGLNGDAVGLKTDERGFVVVDGECRTNLENVWGIGDVVRGPMLAHKASLAVRGDEGSRARGRQADAELLTAQGATRLGP